MAAARRDDIERVHDDDGTAAWLLDVRLRALARGETGAAPPLEPGARSAWVIALALHVFLLLLARPLLQTRAPEPAAAVEVRLIGPAPAPSIAAPPSSPAHTAVRARSLRRATPAVPAEPPAAAEPAPALRLFGIDGGASIPDGLADDLDRARSRGGFPQSVAPSPLLAAKRPLKVRPNHFAQYWDGTDGKPLHETVWRHLTATREFATPWGGRWACAWVLIVVACADVPDKAWSPPQTWKPASELDER